MGSGTVVATAGRFAGAAAMVGPDAAAVAMVEPDAAAVAMVEPDAAAVAMVESDAAAVGCSSVGAWEAALGAGGCSGAVAGVVAASVFEEFTDPPAGGVVPRVCEIARLLFPG